MNEREERLLKLVDRLLADIDSLEGALAIEREFSKSMTQIAEAGDEDKP